MRVGIAVEPVDNFQQDRDGFCVALGDAVRGEAQSRRQAGDLHPLVVRPVVAATMSRRRTGWQTAEKLRSPSREQAINSELAGKTCPP